jgi:hypothetical protein
MKAGRPARFDYEYERNGTDNLFMMFAPLEGWRHVKLIFYSPGSQVIEWTRESGLKRGLALHFL